MKNTHYKIVIALLLFVFAEAGCAKQQFRAKSKRYPHDVPNKNQSRH